MLMYALGRSGIIVPEYIHPLAGEYRMMIRSGKCISDTLLTAQTVAAVLRLTVDSVAGDADWFRQIQCEG